jgi:hypothetical protein
VPRGRPVEPRPVDEKIPVSESHGKREGSATQTAPTPMPPWTILLRKLRAENVPVGLNVGSTSPAPFDELSNYLLMLHLFCDFPVPAIRLFRKQLSSKRNLLPWFNYWP